jgi:hypothetical protein
VFFGHAGKTSLSHNIDCYPTDLVGVVQHNAWWDAMMLRDKLVFPA